MLGRLFNLFLLATLGYVAARALLNRTQRQTLHQLFQTIALALLGSALVLSILCLGGWISRY